MSTAVAPVLLEPGSSQATPAGILVTNDREGSAYGIEGWGTWNATDRLRWQKGRPETAEYHCEGCETPIAEHHKMAMLEGGEWRMTSLSWNAP